MRIIIAGNRHFRDYALLERVMDVTTRRLRSVVVICGLAPGADTLGKLWAWKRGHKVLYFPADWGRLGRAAGPVRNQQMAVAAGPGGGLVAFTDMRPGGGTADMIRRAASRGLRVKVIDTRRRR